ncbi:MAG: FAD-dependent monooxygenase [Actinomycetota bacterium]|nr:FAD-dependent monooxygenase [Actinomycetota bacterium]
MGTHVLISGASIAGPALAHWLHRFGFETTVVERAPGLRPGGQAVDIRGIAKDVVRRMGLDAEVRAACTETAGMSDVTRNNRRIVTMRSDLFDGDGLIAEIEILRGDLSEVFYRATKGTTEYLFGDRIAGLTQHAQGVEVRFSGGSERRFDLVIGADGLHSGVRALAFDGNDGALRHLGHYLSFFTVPNHLGLDRWALGYQEPGRAAGIRSIHDNQDAMAFLSFRSEPLDYDHRDIEGQKQILRERLAGMAWETPWLLERMDDAPDFYFDSCAQVVLGHWSAGRVGLLGDAAFCPSPYSGQGTSLAIVGAYVLAGELAAHPGDHEGAFARYEERLRGFVEANQQLGRRQAGIVSPMSRLGIAKQYAAMLAMVHVPGSSLVMRRLMRAINDIELPDYPLPGPVLT